MEKNIDESIEKDTMEANEENIEVEDNATEETLEEENLEEETLEEAEINEDVEFEDLDEGNTVKFPGKELFEENKLLKNKLDAAQEKLLRITAEYDNYRKRTAKEKENIYTESCADVLKEMLPVLDNLERAITAEGNVDELKKGIEMTIKQFQNSLGKLNVSEIPGEGTFDPNLHNAVMHIDSDEYGQNEVVEVFQKGYIRGDKVLRHSMVKVAN